MTTLRKITRAQVKNVVSTLALKQGGVCPLCKQPLDIRDAGSVVLDHDHISGRIRGALHRSCNSGEGKITQAAGRWIAGKVEYSRVIEVLKNLVVYLEQPPTDQVYYTHKTVDERKAAKAAREKERRARIKAIRELKKPKK